MQTILYVLGAVLITVLGILFAPKAFAGFFVWALVIGGIYGAYYGMRALASWEAGRVSSSEQPSADQQADE